ncbi:hypothetical protein A2108_01625 [Candidatus Wolfebacteria bacterium GWA1_42_9]|uniref:Uncharacterized protein n=1 Tax=Candidatus Wolfebacteria bacterium GWA1_42_9 TaxID=1802553 RepID=A0A1F8DLW1_9BACT|nr:MAG: hypothetical protein A2108_01625 [Candidatus Wolfebacteria bacterium GWA1_42_9]
MKKRRFLNPFQGGVSAELIDSLRKAVVELDKAGVPSVLIGGLSLTFYFPQCSTDDIDFAMDLEHEIPDKMDGFKKITNHMFEDRKNGVIVDIVTPNHINIPEPVFNFALETAMSHVDVASGSTVQVAIPLAVFAIKLSRARVKDQAHLMWMMRAGFKPQEQDLLNIGVPENKIEVYRYLQAELVKELAEEKKMGW